MTGPGDGGYNLDLDPVTGPGDGGYTLDLDPVTDAGKNAEFMEQGRSLIPAYGYNLS